MIKKMTSHDFNNILADTEKKISKVNEEISSIKNSIEKKLLTISHENEYNNHCMNEMTLNLSSVTRDNTTLILLNNNHKGMYHMYSNVVHAHFKKDPLNIFNLKSIKSDSPYFRDEVTVSVNGVSTDHYKTILMADNCDNKEIFFEEFSINATVQNNSIGEHYIDKNNTITISMELDKNKVMGISKFNMIEIDPYLYKSFDIEKIEIFGEDYDKALFTSNKLERVGKTRIILDKKYDFRKVTLTIEPKYTTTRNNVEIIPFGLKHIYFYDADFRNDSYMVVTYNSEEFIDHISNDIKVITPYTIYSSTIKEQGIKIYLDEKDGILENEQEPTMNIKKSIARNLKRIYFKIPIGNVSSDIYNKTLIGFKFNIENR